MGVAQPAHDGDLALDIRHQVGAGNLTLADNLDGDALAGGDVPGVVHLGEGAAAEEFPELILAEQTVAVVHSRCGGY